MPVTYRCDEADRMMIWTTTDPVTLEDWEEAFDRAEADPVVQRLRPTRMMVDLRDRSAFNTGVVVRSLAGSVSGRLSRRARTGIRVAFLVSGGLGHGMVRLASAFIDRQVMEFEIFRNADNARVWLRTEVEA